MKKLFAVLIGAFLAMPGAFAATGLSGAMGQSSSGPSVSLTWTASTACVSPVSCVANVYRAQGQSCPATASSGTWTLIGSGVAESGAYTDANPGTVGANCYYVTDVATGSGWNKQESEGSNLWQATFPVPAPGKLAGSTH